MKTLIKHTPKRATINILTTICVKDGIATATDIDFYLSHPTSLENGLYNPVGFNTPFAKREGVSIADFPIHAPLEGESVVQNHNPATLLEQLTLLAPAMSKDISRWFLKGIYFNKNKIVATNGHILHETSHDKTEVEGKIVPAQAIEILIDLLKECKKEKTVELSFCDNFFIAKIGGYKLVSNFVNGIYPDYERIIPTNFWETCEYKASDFKAIKNDIFLLNRQSGSHANFCVSLENKTLTYKERVFPITSELKGSFDFRFLLNTRDGIVHYKILGERDSPIKITHDLGLTVIMPMRGGDYND